MLSNPEMQVNFHLLVIPYRHVVHLSDLTDEEYWDYSKAMREFQKRIRESGAGLGCDSQQNNRPFLPESEEKVDHVHGHLILRFFNDALYQESQKFERFTMIPPEAMRWKEKQARQILQLD